MSQARGLVTFRPTMMRQMRWMPPRSASTNMPATQMQAGDTMTAGIEILLKLSMPNTCAELATIKPPADKPTKNMKQVI